MTWARGHARIEQLLADGELEIVTASEAHAHRLLDEAQRHLRSAEQIASDDTTGAYQLAYDAARKACSALLAVQGLRATTKGGHIAIQDAVREQFVPPSPSCASRRRQAEGPSASDRQGASPLGVASCLCAGAPGGLEGEPQLGASPGAAVCS